MLKDLAFPNEIVAAWKNRKRLCKGLKAWYAQFNGRPPVFLVHSQAHTLESPGNILKNELNAPVILARCGQAVDMVNPGQII